MVALDGETWLRVISHNTARIFAGVSLPRSSSDGDIRKDENEGSE